ncbi:iron-sulfur assembly protein 1, partial [Aspergillus brasiliensis]
MALCKATMPSPVTSSATILTWLRQSSSRRSTQTCRLFSSYGNAHRSSKRELQTATAYRPHSLPTSFPPPRNTGIPDTSIAADFPSLREMSQPQMPGQQGLSDLSLRESEAQKSKPVPAPAP